jgi:hypothetical protein
VLDPTTSCVTGVGQFELDWKGSRVVEGCDIGAKKIKGER